MICEAERYVGDNDGGDDDCDDDYDDDDLVEGQVVPKIGY